MLPAYGAPTLQSILARNPYQNQQQYAPSQSFLDSIKDTGLGLLAGIGDVMDRPGSAFRGAMTGNEDFWRALVPFGESLGVYDPKKHRTSGQDLLEYHGFFAPGKDEGLLTGKGAARFGAEMIADPLNLLPGWLGVKALTKSGRAAAKVAGHMDEVADLARAVGAARKAEGLTGAIDIAGLLGRQAERGLFKKVDRVGQLAKLEGKFGGRVLTEAGEALPEQELLRMLGGQQSELGGLARGLAESGAPARLAGTAAERAQLGQEALFSVGGQWHPFGIGPSIELPQWDIVTNPAIQQGISDVIGGIGRLPGIKQVGDLFRRTPAGKAALRATGEARQSESLMLERVNAAEKAFQSGELQEAARLMGGGPKSPQAQVVNMAVESGLPQDAVMDIAKKHSAEGMASGASEAAMDALRRGLEGGEVPENIRPVLNAIVDEYKNIAKYEKAYIGLKPMAANYAPHMVTKEGRSALKQKPFLEKFKELFVKAYEAKTGEPFEMPIQIGAPGRVTNKKLASKLEEIGLTDNFLEEVMHGSMHARKYTGLTIDELNEVARQAGVKGNLFETNPFKLLKIRGMRHARVRGVVDYFDGVEKLGLGTRVGAESIESILPSRINGVNQVALKGGQTAYGVADASGKGQILFRSPEEAHEVAKAAKLLTTDVSLSSALALYDQVSRGYKMALTRAFPSFHSRNRFENRVKSLMEDVPVFGKHNKLANLAAAGKDFTVKLGDGTTMTYNSLLEELRSVPEHQIMSGGGQIEALMRDAAEQAARSKKQSALSPFGLIEKVAGAAEKVAAGAFVAPGQILAGAGMDMTRANGQMLDAVDRLRHYIFKRMDGYSVRDAAENVTKAQFDYSTKAMNSFEREWLDRMVMFYGYTRSVIPYVIEKAFTEPRKLQPWLRLANAPGKDDALPPWLREGMSVPLYKQGGQTRYMRTLGTPVEAAVEPFAGFADGLGRGLAKLGSRLHPIPKGFIELATGKDLFLGRDIKDLRKQPHWVGKLPKSVREALGIWEVRDKEGNLMRYEGNAWQNWVLRNSPVARFSQTISTGMDERNPVFDVGLNTLLGPKLTSFDPKRESRYREREFAIGRLRELEQEGMARQFNIWGTTPQGRVDPETRMLINLLGGK